MFLYSVKVGCEVSLFTLISCVFSFSRIFFGMLCWSSEKTWLLLWNNHRYTEMMKWILSATILFLFCALHHAQTMSVSSFVLDESDLTANLQGTIVLDQNGGKCALIRIQTTHKPKSVIRISLCRMTQRNPNDRFGLWTVQMPCMSSTIFMS